MVQNLSPSARGRINRDLNRKSTKTLQTSLQKIHDRISEIIEIHQSGTELSLMARVERMINLFRSSPIHIQLGGESLDTCNNNQFQNRMGSFWIPETTWQQIEENNVNNLTFCFEAKTPSVHHWVHEVLFAHGFNPVAIKKYQFGSIVEVTSNCEIERHTPPHLLLAN